MAILYEAKFSAVGYMGSKKPFSVRRQSRAFLYIPLKNGIFDELLDEMRGSDFSIEKVFEAHLISHRFAKHTVTLHNSNLHTFDASSTALLRCCCCCYYSAQRSSWRVHEPPWTGEEDTKHFSTLLSNAPRESTNHNQIDPTDDREGSQTPPVESVVHPKPSFFDPPNSMTWYFAYYGGP